MREEYLNVFQINRVLNTDLDSIWDDLDADCRDAWKCYWRLWTDERDVWEYYDNHSVSGLLEGG